MDIHKILRGVKTLNDYIAATEKIDKCSELEIQLNMSTVLNLKNVRSLEIEYFNKCEGIGAAFAVFKTLLKQPPSKTWGLLGKELISMLQYWLDAVRRHLISHSYHWWTFLKALLGFVKEIKSKHPLLLNIIVEQTTDCLLDISCNGRLDELQRQEVLHTVNEYSAESSRELRNRMTDRFSGYFIKLGTILSTCGHLPAQLSILELLLRWLVRRHDPQVRRDAAAAWFPHPLFKREAVELFLERPWTGGFFEDARDFLNIHNANCPSRVTSVVCKKLSIGGVELIEGPQRQETWLDINAGTRTLSVLLEPSGPPGAARGLETLLVAADNVRAVQLTRTASATVVSVQTVEPPRPGGARRLAATVSSRRLVDLDNALKIVFAHKYQRLVNEDTLTTRSSSNSDQDSRPRLAPRKFSSPDEDRHSGIPVRRRRHSGFIVSQRNQPGLNSPSTASTTSLAQLHDKLASLPHIIYSKEPIKVSIQPELSMVREVSECEERTPLLSGTPRPRHFGEQHGRAKKRNLSPLIQNKDKPSNLTTAATHGSADQSIINDTCENIIRDSPGLVDLLIKEGLQNGKEGDSGIIIDNKTQDSGVIENTPLEKQARKNKLAKNRKAKCTVVSNSTTDESNTEAVTELPCYVSERKKIVITDTIIVEEANACDDAAVDAFFSQHVANKNSTERLVISPALAKEINETSSEAYSEDIIGQLDENNFVFESEIIECLNNIVDEVCSNFDKCAEMSSKENDENVILKIAQHIDLNERSKAMNKSKESNNVSSSDDTRNIKLKFPKANKRATTKQRKAKEGKVSDNTIMEENDVLIENINTNSPINKNNTPIITRKKRKLYSPKDVDNDKMEDIPRARVESKQSNVNRTPIATCYKDIEMARRNISRIPRKSRSSSETMSPRTKKRNDMFDKLKEKVDNEEKITIVNRKSNKKDLTVYNFSSDSDDDFLIETKRNELQKRISSTNLKSRASKRGRLPSRAKYTESNNSSADESKRKPKRRKLVKQTKPRGRSVPIEPCIDLIDERMRETAPEDLETSFIKKTSGNNKVQEPEPALKQAPAMELIPENNHDATAVINVEEHKSQRAKRSSKILQIKKEKGINKKAEKTADIVCVTKEKRINKQKLVKNRSDKDSGAESPLPGLVVETEKRRLDDMTASVNDNMLQKFKKLYTEGPDVDEEIDLTQNLIFQADKSNSPGGINNVINLDVFDLVDIATNEELNNDVEIRDLDTFVAERAASEKSIPTVGTSPITAHNDHNESPPNVELLQQTIEERDLEIQDMNQSTAEFFVQLRKGLQANKTPRASTDKRSTSPVLPITTRISSKEFPMTPKSGTSTAKVVLSRLSSKEIEKYVSPVKSKSSRSSLSTAEVVIERLSSDEINKWLPMPSTNRRRDEEIPKKCEKRFKTKKTRVVKKTPEKQVKKNKKSLISPIKLSFNINDDPEVSSYSSNKENENGGNKNSTETSKSQTRNNAVDKSEPTQSVSQKSQGTEKIEKIHTKQDCVQKSSSESVNISPVVENGPEIDTNIHTNRQQRDISNSEEMSGVSGSIASVNDWFKRNVSQQIKSKADTDLAKEIIEKVMGAVKTTLDEIHQSTGHRLALNLMADQNSLRGLTEKYEDVLKRMKEELLAVIETKFTEASRLLNGLKDAHERAHRERARALVREESARKQRMVQLLAEDLQDMLNVLATPDSTS